MAEPRRPSRVTWQCPTGMGSSGSSRFLLRLPLELPTSVLCLRGDHGVMSPARWRSLYEPRNRGHSSGARPPPAPPSRPPSSPPHFSMAPGLLRARRSCTGSSRPWIWWWEGERSCEAERCWVRRRGSVLVPNRPLCPGYIIDEAPLIRRGRIEFSGPDSFPVSNRAEKTSRTPNRPDFSRPRGLFGIC